MKRKSFVSTVLVGLLAVCFGLSLTGCSYNTLVAEREAVDGAWANVENQYQRRADLIPNLVSTVKGYAAHEESIFKEVSDARAKLGSTVIADSSITDDPEKLAQFQQAQEALGASLSHLIAIAEAYPDLKANTNFQELQSQLEGTENRIATERKRYNDAVQQYNTAIQSFPGLISAKIFGFTAKAYFKTDSSNYAAPSVTF